MRTLLLFACLASAAFAQTFPPGFWPVEKSQPIIDKTGEVRLAPDLSRLSAGEKIAVQNLLQAGKIIQALYEESRHPQALSSAARLNRLDRRLGSPAFTKNLLTIYRLQQGPIATTLDNKREAFLPVDPVAPGKNVYPWGITKAEVDAFLAANSQQSADILHPRSVVRRATAAALAQDLGLLQSHRALTILHPGLEQRLNRLRAQPNPNQLYAVPYAVAYADQLSRVYGFLNAAADAIAAEDVEFAAYLRNRARDMLTNDYESGDASWITGRFKNLNAQIGSYETYDDELFGVKTFYGLSLMLTNQQESQQLRQAMKGLQAIHESLPYKTERKIREDIPVGVYAVIADFGQTRGGNTATILPNDATISRKYGRTIMLRANIMRAPENSSTQGNTWKSVVAPEHAGDLTADGTFYRTLWHEVGHYLGVDVTKDGRELDTALQDAADLLEEMKADLVSLHSAKALRAQDYYTEAQLRSVYAGGILRTLQNNRPRRDQPYQTMQLMQFNFFLKNGLLRFDPAGKRLHIDYAKYHQVVESLLKQVLEVQHNGDKQAAERFIAEYTTWSDDVHGAVASQIRGTQQYRFRLYKYAALGE
ncbi:MAG TPA: hypothetical protein VM056_06940 [Terriglobales bacterium]|nr:hypothetical protein [Terriglobales bacterium]